MTTANTSKIETQIEEERKGAREACDINGATSPECAAAWDAVEELQAEAAHQSQVKPKTNFENYCSDNPDAVECRIYED
ncbi:Calvin cycle protein CP12 [filamentous cyanobacterium LEGE 11480]|uniref:Calvin cycle protein CP12 n=1 Tax=Romeriopsis navalis LEGE 11480 TaxID=2777977 RepID=A0A928VW87_9CYAN|nr:Calvin cycle protein CP12 [Romeriopsis navalis]MBE9033314.1 Calvin cycle protein CP12 [Romeriopsis navalis LEGE 11480]